MNKEKWVEWKPKNSMSALDDTLALYYNLWDLADKILEAGEITDELFERIGVVLVMKLMAESLAKKNTVYGGGIAKGF